MWIGNLIFLCAFLLPVLVYSQDETFAPFEKMINTMNITSHVTNSSDMTNTRKPMGTTILITTDTFNSTDTSYTNGTWDTLDTMDTSEATEILDVQDTKDSSNMMKTIETWNTGETSVTTETTEETQTTDTTEMTGMTNITDTTDIMELTNLEDTSDTTDTTDTWDIIYSSETTDISYTTDTTDTTDLTYTTDSTDPTYTTDSTDLTYTTDSTDPTYTTGSTDPTYITDSTDTADTTEMAESLEMTETTETSENEKLAKGEKKLSENILAILEHYKQPDPMGLPGIDLTEPCPVPDSQQAVSFDTMYFSNTVVYGINKFKILYMKADVKNMKIQAEMSVDKLDVHGYYILSSWFNPASGPYSVNSTGVKVKAIATLGVEQDGNLRAKDIHIDVTVDTFVTKFENLGLLGEMFQSSMNARGPSALDSSLPSMLQEAYPKIRAEINKKIDEIAGDIQFANSISPLDLVIMDVRNLMRHMKLDPFRMNNYNTSMGIFTVALSKTEFTGMSSFQRFGNITLTMKNNTVVADFEVGTKKLEGHTEWDISALAGLTSTAGTASFSIEYISARIILEQPLDTRKQPVLGDLTLDVGNIQVRSDGIGTLDYVIEFAINVLPNLLRYQIMDVLEFYMKTIVQQKLDELNVDETIKLMLPKLDEMQGFQLSALKIPMTEDHQYDKDEFFNF